MSYSVNDTDITLEKRIKYFYQNYYLDDLCGENCVFNSFVYNEKSIICSCDFSDSINDLSISTSNQIIKTNNFEGKINKNIYKSFSCEFKNIKKNYSSYIILFCIIVQIICFNILLIFKRIDINIKNSKIKITNVQTNEKSNFEFDNEKKEEKPTSNYEIGKDKKEVNEKTKIKIIDKNEDKNKTKKVNFWKNYFKILKKYNNIFSLIFKRDLINIIFRIIVIIFMFSFCIFVNIFFIDNDYISNKFEYALNSKNKINHFEYAFEHIQIKIILSIFFGIIVDLIFQFLFTLIISKKKNNLNSFHFIIFGIIILLMICFWYFISSFTNIFNKILVDLFLRGIISFFTIILFSFIFCLFFNLYIKI